MEADGGEVLHHDARAGRVGPVSCCPCLSLVGLAPCFNRVSLLHQGPRRVAGKALCGRPKTFIFWGEWGTTIVVTEIAEIAEIAEIVVVVVVVVAAGKEIGTFELGQASPVILEIVGVQSRLLVMQCRQGCHQVLVPLFILSCLPAWPLVRV